MGYLSLISIRNYHWEYGKVLYLTKEDEKSLDLVKIKGSRLQQPMVGGLLEDVLCRHRQPHELLLFWSDLLPTLEVFLEKGVVVMVFGHLDDLDLAPGIVAAFDEGMEHPFL